MTCLLNILYYFSDLTSFSPSNVTRIQSSPVQDGYHVIYTLFVDYPSGRGPIQQNLLAAILTIRLENIENETNMRLEIITSILAPSPPAADSNKTDESVTMVARNINASQVINKYNFVEAMRLNYFYFTKCLGIRSIPTVYWFWIHLEGALYSIIQTRVANSTWVYTDNLRGMSFRSHFISHINSWS